MVRELIERGRQYGPDAPSWKLAGEMARKLSSGRQISRMEVGYLINATANAEAEAALQQLREAYAAGEISEEEFDRAYDALGIGVDAEGGGQYSVSNAEIQAVQGIGRKSVNDFTTEDLQKTETFARMYWREMGVKSPFFRAWFGDWRANDKTPIQVVNVNRDAPYKAGKTVNNDTGRVISWGNDFQRETRAHQRSDGIASSIVGNIESLVKNAVLLDTVTSGRSSKTKLPGTTFMHSFYALAREADGNISLMKLYAEEAVSAGGNPFTRAYELKDIEKVAVTANGVLSIRGGLTDAATSTNINVADLFEAVKRYDADFNPQSASKVVDEDGRPLVVYHGTDADFTVFDRSKGRSTMDIQGPFFFTVGAGRRRLRRKRAGRG